MNRGGGSNASTSFTVPQRQVHARDIRQPRRAEPKHKQKIASIDKTFNSFEHEKKREYFIVLSLF